VTALPTLPAPRTARPRAPALLHLWHLTSLDAPTVAVAWCLAFAWAARISLPFWLPLVLALAAWSFYLLDRLFDARRCLSPGKGLRLRQIASSPLRPRHYFHWKYRRFFAPAAVVAAIAAVVLVMHSMPLAARERNSVLAAAAVVYFTSVHSPWSARSSRLRLPKELLVGILFTLACAAPAWSRVLSHRTVFAASVLVYMALAWLNCAAIETWESGRVPDSRIFRLALALAFVALSAAAACAALGFGRMASLLGAAALSSGWLAGLDRRGSALAPTTLRAAADLALLTPLFFLLLP
jgi:hypothetical protein